MTVRPPAAPTAVDPCRCVYPDKCFCPPEAKAVPPTAAQEAAATLQRRGIGVHHSYGCRFRTQGYCDSFCEVVLFAALVSAAGRAAQLEDALTVAMDAAREKKEDAIEAGNTFEAAHYQGRERAYHHARSLAGRPEGAPHG